MKLKALLLLPLLAIGLAGCDGGGEKALTKQEMLDHLAAQPTNLVTTEGAQVESEFTAKLKYGVNLIAAVETEYTKEDKKTGEKEVLLTAKVEWTFSDDNWIEGKYKDENGKTDPTHVVFIAKEVFETSAEYVTNITAKFTADDLSATVTYKVRVLHGEFDVYSLEDYRKAVSSGELKANADVKVYGYITGMHRSGEEYTGFYIQDGAYGLMLYAGSITTDLKTYSFKVGDLVYACGSSSDYHGLLEMKSSAIRPATEAEKTKYHVAEPTYTQVAAGEFTAAKLKLLDGALVQMDNLTFVTIGDSATGTPTNDYDDQANKQAYAWFKDSTDALVKLSLNYHISDRTELKEMFASWTCNSTVVDFKGHLTWYDAPNLIPVRGTSCFTVH